MYVPREAKGVAWRADASHDAASAHSPPFITMVAASDFLCFVSVQEAASFALENRLIYVETSAKTNINIDRLFTEVATRAPHTPTAAGPKAAVKLGKASVRGTPERGAAAGGCCG
ncbi:MAG: hypothetical protein EOO41_00855 [Methanobacteriota archaeon]|nr:MAG: hypothetical protein EOO41_00855 [Euryarchaeota archaeon]